MTAERETVFSCPSPRPWRRDDGPDGQWDLVVVGKHRGSVYGFDATHDTPQAQADAALIVKAVNGYDRLRVALADLLDVAERIRGGDPSLDPEEWYLARDFARVVLKDTE